MLLVHSSKIFRLVFCNSIIFLEYHLSLIHISYP
ncbi:hypothetical protein A5848_000245, partial [Enterococcus faecium]